MVPYQVSPHSTLAKERTNSTIWTRTCSRLQVLPSPDSFRMHRRQSAQEDRRQASPYGVEQRRREISPCQVATSCSAPPTSSPEVTPHRSTTLTRLMQPRKQPSSLLSTHSLTS